MKLMARTKVGIRASAFSNAVLFLTTILKLELVYLDREKEFAQYKLPSGQMLELFGEKNIWHPFTTPPDWEVIVADIRYAEKSESQ